MKLPEPMKQLSDDYIRGWNECLQAVRDMNNTEDKDGWIPWSGGDCPVYKHALVDVKFRSGKIGDTPEMAEDWSWSHENLTGDIVAYKVVG